MGSDERGTSIQTSIRRVGIGQVSFGGLASAKADIMRAKKIGGPEVLAVDSGELGVRCTRLGKELLRHGIGTRHCLPDQQAFPSEHVQLKRDSFYTLLPVETWKQSRWYRPTWS
jgi:hypothetical protein